MPGRLLARAAIGLALAAAAAHAEEPPWSRGVSAEHKAQAQRLLEQGNALFLANKHTEALAAYEAAIRVWDHPAIRFNMVRSQVALERMIDAFENLEKALAYGASPLEDSVYREALNYQRMLARQVGTLDVTCTQAGVTVQVDADAVLACPTTKRVRRLPGLHRVVASGEGFEPMVHERALAGGETLRLAISLSRSVASGRRWAAWKPWAVVAGGAVVAGAGVVLNVRGRRHADDLGARSRAECPQGCTAAEYETLGLAALEDSVKRDNVLSVTGISVGVAALLLGGALVIVNRDVSEGAVVDVRPGGATVGARFRF